MSKFDGYTHQQLMEMLQAGKPPSITTMADDWRRVSRAFDEFAMAVDRGLRELEGGGWRGDAADAYIADMRNLVQTAEQASREAETTKGALSGAEGHLSDAQGAMPPVYDKSDFVDTIENNSPLPIPAVSVTDWGVDSFQSWRAEQDRQEAIRVLEDLNAKYDADARKVGDPPPYDGPPTEHGRRPLPPWPPDSGYGPQRPGSHTRGPGSGAELPGLAASPEPATPRGFDPVGSVDSPSRTVDPSSDSSLTDGPGGTSTAGAGVGPGGTLPGGPTGGPGAASGAPPGGGGRVPGGIPAGGGVAGGGVTGGLPGGGRVGGVGGAAGAGGRLPGGAAGGSGGRGGRLGAGGVSGGPERGGGATGGGRGAGGRMGMMPMGGAGAGGGQGNDKQRRSWLQEQEDVWSPKDKDVAPGVLGQDPIAKKNDDEDDF